jgi:hypothetical protein
MFTGFYKLLVEKNLPLRVIEFPMAMRKKVSTGTFPTEVLRSKILETIWKLKDNDCVSMTKSELSTYMIEVGDMTT